MTLNITHSNQCVVPSEGDVFILPRDRWASVGMFGVVYNDPRVSEEDKRRTIPLNFMHELSVAKSLGRISTNKPSKFILRVAKVQLT